MHDQTVGYGSTAPMEQHVDEALAEQLTAQLHEAAERVTFHRCELERWERVGRAAAVALSELQAHSPVAKQAPEDFGREARVGAGIPEGVSLGEVRR